MTEHKDDSDTRDFLQSIVNTHKLVMPVIAIVLLMATAVEYLFITGFISFPAAVAFFAAIVLVYLGTVRSTVGINKILNELINSKDEEYVANVKSFVNKSNLRGRMLEESIYDEFYGKGEFADNFWSMFQNNWQRGRAERAIRKDIHKTVTGMSLQ